MEEKEKRIHRYYALSVLWVFGKNVNQGAALRYAI